MYCGPYIDKKSRNRKIAEFKTEFIPKDKKTGQLKPYKNVPCNEKCIYWNECLKELNLPANFAIKELEKLKK
jgi:hypothetical protein